MATFDFYLDTKVTTWYRTPFEIEADTLEEAKQKAIDYVKDDGHYNDGWEQIDDTPEIMSIKENGGESTEELYTYEDGEMIWDNGEN